MTRPPLPGNPRPLASSDGRRGEWSDLIVVVVFGYSAFLAGRNIAPLTLGIAPVAWDDASNRLLEGWNALAAIATQPSKLGKKSWRLIPA
jgi:hypothetical protein